MRFLESDRLLIRPVEMEDIEKLLQIRWDSAVMEYSLHEPISVQQQIKWFQNIPDKDLPMSIFIKDSDNLKLIGTIGLYNISRLHQRATLRIRLCKEVLGKGYGYKSMKMLLDYAFKTLNLKKITSDCFSDNTATIKIKIKLGFVKEGFLRQHYYHNGQFKDADVYGLLKEDFYNAVKD